MQSDQKLLAALAKKLGSNTALADALGVTWGQLKNWRIYRDVPPAFRARVATLANMHGFDLGLAWIDTATLKINGGKHGRAGKRNGKAQARKAQGKRRRPQQRKGRGLSKVRHSGRGAATAP